MDPCCEHGSFASLGRPRQARDNRGVARNEVFHGPPKQARDPRQFPGDRHLGLADDELSLDAESHLAPREGVAFPIPTQPSACPERLRERTCTLALATGTWFDTCPRRGSKSNLLRWDPLAAGKTISGERDRRHSHEPDGTHRRRDITPPPWGTTVLLIAARVRQRAIPSATPTDRTRADTGLAPRVHGLAATSRPGAWPRNPANTRSK